MTRQHSAPWIFLVIAVLALGAPASAQKEAPGRAAANGVLARLVGSWDAEITVPRNQWLPNGATARAKAVNEWVSEGRVLRSTWSVQSDEGKPLLNGTTECTFDPKSGYRSVATFSTGISYESAGTWDEKSGTMSWIARDPKTKMVTITKSNLATGGIEKWTMVVADPKSGPVFECSGINTRRSK